MLSLGKASRIAFLPHAKESIPSGVRLFVSSKRLPLVESLAEFHRFIRRRCGGKVKKLRRIERPAATGWGCTGLLEFVLLRVSAAAQREQPVADHRPRRTRSGTRLPCAGLTKCRGSCPRPGSSFNRIRHDRGRSISGTIRDLLIKIKRPFLRRINNNRSCRIAQCAGVRRSWAR